MNFNDAHFNNLANTAFLGYRETSEKVSLLLEQLGLEIENYFVDMIIDDCFENDGTMYYLVVEKDELMSAILNSEK